MHGARGAAPVPPARRANGKVHMRGCCRAPTSGQGSCCHGQQNCQGARMPCEFGRHLRRSSRRMTDRVATCRCGQLQAICKGEPVRVSVCHCLDCQKRTGSAFAAQARWPDSQVEVRGQWKTWVRIADSGHKATYRFCPVCGSTVAYVIEGWPDVTAVPLGAFADPEFPAPRFSVYEHRQHRWVAVLGEDVKHSSSPSPSRPDRTKTTPPD